MGKRSGSKVQVTKYLMTAHYGICVAADALTGIFIGEKPAWTGEAKDEGAISIWQPELFGGPKKEGGVGGQAYFLPGGPLQIVPDGLAARYGKTGFTSPGYRGLASIFFLGRLNHGDGWVPGVGQTPKGFYWGANNPYLRAIWARVRRAPRGLNPSIAMVRDDANPAHIIFECLVDRDWGMGASIGLIDVLSFELAAQTLSAEDFGISMQWTRQAAIEDFVGEVIDHIQATLFVNPRTGLLTLKLLREDYDIASLRTVTPDNARLTNYQRKTWGETTNEIVVTYTNPDTEEEETVGAQDLANIAMQGGEVVSASRNYYGVRRRELAARLAERDLRLSSMPLASCDATLLREHWDILPGEVVKLTWPEYGIEQLVVRAGPVDYGRPGEGTIKVSFYEDVFSLAAAQYLDAPASDWSEPGTPPHPATDVLAHTAPAFLTASLLDLSSPADLPEPEAVTMILASYAEADGIGFELVGDVTQVNGSVSAQSLGDYQFSGRAALRAPLSAEARTTVASFGDGVGSTPALADFLLIGTGPESACEIATVDRVDEGGWHLLRGVLDTVPTAWPLGTPVRNLSAGVKAFDLTRRSQGEEVDYRLRTRTSRGLLPLGEAPVERMTVTARPHLPLRPANVRVNGEARGPVTYDGSDFALTWSNRDRIGETSRVMTWDAASVLPETGQTTLVEALSTGGELLSSHDAGTGTSFAIGPTAFGGARAGRVRVLATRDGLRSLQAFEIAVDGMDAFTLGLSGTESGSLLLSGDAQGGTDKLLLGAH